MKKFEFGELAFTKEELRTLPKPIYSFLVGSCLAANDIIVLQRLAITHSHMSSKDPIVSAYVAVNYLVLIRILSAKVYEYIRFVEGFVKKAKRSKSENLSGLTEIAVEFLKWKDKKSFDVVRDLRDKVTNHYSGGDDPKYLDALQEDMIPIYLNRMNGNSLYPLGEYIATMGQLYTKDGRLGLPAMVSWTVSTSGAAISFQHEMTREILGIYFPHKGVKIKTAAVESRFISTDKLAAPLFFDDEDVAKLKANNPER